MYDLEEVTRLLQVFDLQRRSKDLKLLTMTSQASHVLQRHPSKQFACSASRSSHRNPPGGGGKTTTTYFSPVFGWSRNELGLTYWDATTQRQHCN